MNDITELWQLITLASEADVRGSATQEEKELLEQHRAIHLEVLKAQKQRVEYQFSSHKAVITQYYAELLSKKITLEQYTERRKEQFLWKTKAISYLIRIEERMSQIKMDMKTANE